MKWPNYHNYEATNLTTEHKERQQKAKGKENKMINMRMMNGSVRERDGGRTT